MRQVNTIGSIITIDEWRKLFCEIARAGAFKHCNMVKVGISPEEYVRATMLVDFSCGSVHIGGYSLELTINHRSILALDANGNWEAIG